jgi:hypothetical protein
MSTSLAYMLNGTLDVGVVLALCASMTVVYRSLLTTDSPSPPGPGGGAWTPVRGPEPPRLGPRPSRCGGRPGSPAPGAPRHASRSPPKVGNRRHELASCPSDALDASPALLTPCRHNTLTRVEPSPSFMRNVGEAET